MAEKLLIIDYGSGNIRSAEKAFAKAAADSGVAIDIHVSCDPDDVKAADRLVLPGVGAFGDCAKGIQRVDGLWDAIDDTVTNQAKPFFGICVGMQLMAKEGLEHGTHQGFGWLDGTVSALTDLGFAKGLKVPHMGWNALDVTTAHPVLADVRQGDHVYFVHSYAMAGKTLPVLATTDYGGAVTAFVGTGTAVGSQFHPEKSQAVGLSIIANFLRWRP